MTVPTVNVIMTHDPAKMIEFGNTGSLEVFVNENIDNADVLVFTNAPNSNFISLTHSYGKDKTAKLELELMDPENRFSDVLTASPDLASMDITTDLVKAQFQAKLDELDGLYAQRTVKAQELADMRTAASLPGVSTTTLNAEISLAWVDEQIELLKESIEEDDHQFGSGPIASGPDADNLSTKIQNYKLLKKQLALQSSPVVRPVYVTYGVGDNLLDWSPPMAFDKTYKAEFSFNATGTKILKLFYSGVSMHPSLTRAGLRPMGDFSKNILIAGTSRKLFNQEELDLILSRYEDQYAKSGTYIVAVSDNVSLFRPSLHLTIRDALINFVKNALGNKNVVCLLPDLDKYLRPFFLEQLTAVRGTNSLGPDPAAGSASIAPGITLNNVLELEATRETLEALGLQLTDTQDDQIGAVSTSVYQNLEDQSAGGGDPALIQEWLENRSFTASISCDGLNVTFLQKIQEIFTNINNAITTYYKSKDSEGNTTAPPEFNFSQHLESDFGIIQSLFKHGIIDDIGSQVFIMGDTTTISNYLEGRLLDNGAFEADAITDSIENSLSPMDIVDGFTSSYVQDVWEKTFGPIPYLGPFGPTGAVGGSLDAYLPGDSNVNSESYEEIKNSQDPSKSRMPVFSFGTKNPNILSFEIDINQQFSNLANKFTTVNLTNALATSTILGPGQRQAMESIDLWSQVKNIQDMDLVDVDADGVPDSFKALLGPYFDTLSRSTEADGSSQSASRNTYHKMQLQNIVKLVDEIGANVNVVYSKKLFRTKRLRKNTWKNMFGLYGDSWKGQADGTESELVERSASDDEIEEARNQFFVFMWKTFSALTREVPRSTIRQGGVATMEQCIANHAKLTNQLTSLVVSARITTLPMFNLSSRPRVIGRDSLVLGIEPTIQGVDYNMKEYAKKSSWFSGVYQVYGFEHRISTSDVTSEFVVNKVPTGGGLIEFD